MGNAVSERPQTEDKNVPILVGALMGRREEGLLKHSLGGFASRIRDFVYVANVRMGEQKSASDEIWNAIGMIDSLVQDEYNKLSYAYHE